MDSVTKRPARARRLLWQALLLIPIAAFALTGCTRSLRHQAADVATAGCTTSNQMAAYYDTLAKDTVDVWEMTAFQRGYSGLPQTDLTGALQHAYQDRYLALLARKRFAGVIADTYGQFSKLASYDSSEDVMSSLKKLNEAATGLQGRPLIPPDAAIGPVKATSAISALVTELQTVAENRAILRENKRLVSLLEKVKDVFDAELPVYKSIADDKKRVFKDVAQSLVKSGAVDSSALVNRVLDSYELKWPTPAKAFNPNDPAQKPLVDAIVEVIEARANPIAQLSRDAGDKLSGALDQLLVLHKMLVAGKPLTFKEMAEQNAVVQDLLDALKPKLDIRKLIGVGESK